MAVFANLDRTVPVIPGDRIAVHEDKSPNARDYEQPNVALRPRYGRAPVNVRNRLPNNSTAGAAVGVVGSGGALPTYWSLQFSGGDAAGAGEVVAVGPDYCDVFITQTGSSGAMRLEFNITPIEAAEGQQWALSSSLALLSGSIAGLSQLRLSLRGNSGSLASLAATTPSLTSTLARFSGAVTLNEPLVTGIIGDFRVTNNGPWTGTIRISLPQLERAAAATNVQITSLGGLNVTEAGVATYPFARYDLSDDVLPTTLSGGDYSVLIAGRKGAWVEHGVTIAPGGTFAIGPTTFTGGAAGVLPAVGDVVGVIVTDRTLADLEINRLLTRYQARGAGPLLESV